MSSPDDALVPRSSRLLVARHLLMGLLGWWRANGGDNSRAGTTQWCGLGRAAGDHVVLSMASAVVGSVRCTMSDAVASTV